MSDAVHYQVVIAGGGLVGSSAALALAKRGLRVGLFERRDPFDRFASVLLFIQPVGSVLLGMLILDESPSALQLWGVVVILAGVGVATIPARRRVEVAQPVAAPAVDTPRATAVPHRPSR